ncbi:hypothetical protein HNP55_002225 [Paucibacter oligotrophus]|uniref:Uncharacterized protein n=1 Tax=Roseateles oligotrophus TaxID=1769250 RepID=A0A840LAL7_9BURK|nr:hypothetical protein [Roseateles oligotrophus]MBB4843702.1 hypothetical protein [Roseateles oligotrophus]
MRAFKPTRCRPHLLGLALLALLSACGGGSNKQDEHGAEGHSINTAGRLAVAEKGAALLRIHDLDSATLEASSFTLDDAPSALYTSPGGRYVLAAQRNKDQLQFIDGGVWQENHGDHLHDYKQAAKALSWKLTGARPTHVDVQPGKQVAIFMDGNATSQPVQNAAVRLLSDASIAAGNTLAGLDLTAPIHGLAEPVDNKLLVVHRAADAGDSLPTHLQLYQREGSAYRSERLLGTRCDGMHGSASSGKYTAVGCKDGVLLVKHIDATTVLDSKLSAPLRISSLAGHPKLPGQFIGIGSEGAAPGPVTTRFYAIDAEAGTVAPLLPKDWAEGRLRRAHAFDRSGTRLFLLDDTGTLTVLQRQGNAWVHAARLPAAIAAMPTAAPWPAMAANGAKDELYLSDPQASQLLVLDTSKVSVTARRSLGYVPAALTWTGISR